MKTFKGLHEVTSNINWSELPEQTKRRMRIVGINSAKDYNSQSKYRVVVTRTLRDYLVEHTVGIMAFMVSWVFIVTSYTGFELEKYFLAILFGVLAISLFFIHVKYIYRCWDNSHAEYFYDLERVE